MAAGHSTRARLHGLPSFIRLTLMLGLGLAVASWLFVLGSDRLESQPFFSMETLERGASFLHDLLGAGSSGTPAFMRWDSWAEVAPLAYRTLVMSVLGISMAGIVALLTFMFGARNVMLGELSPPGAWLWRGWYFVIRALFVLARGVPELLWAMLLVFVFTPGILPGAIALGIHNSGILGKLASEVVEGLDPGPLRALRSTGSGRLQMLLYGVLPEALPRFLTYSLYRWEVIIRTTIVVGFVAAGGLGMEFRLSMSYFHYTDVALLLLWYLGLVLAVDLAAAGLRRLAQ